MRGEPQRGRGQGPRRGRPHDARGHPADDLRSPPQRRQLQREPALQAPQRADLRRPRGGPADLDQRARAAVDVRGHDRAGGGLHERAAAPAGRPRALPHALERRAGDRRACSSRSAPTRRSSSAASCGGRRGSRSSSRPRTRARRSSRRRACARACGSASAGSPRSSTSSRRTSPTSRRCCRCASRRTRWRCSTRGGVPKLGELRLHNGTVYRWNRPVYDVVRGKPHLRVENRVLPAGPTVVDTLANAAFYYGLVRMLVEEERPIWSRMSFSAAEENFHAGARDGIDARVFWPGLGEVPASELVLRRLLPLAHEGLERWDVDAVGPRPAARDHRAALPDPAQRRDLAGRDVPPALRRPRHGPRRRRCAR